MTPEAFSRSMTGATMLACEIADPLDLAAPQKRETRDRAVAALADDERFSFLLSVIVESENQYAVAIARQDLAAHNGCLQHCAGSLYALQKLRELIRDLAVVSALRDQRRRQGIAPPDATPES